MQHTAPATIGAAFLLPLVGAAWAIAKMLGSASAACGLAWCSKTLAAVLVGYLFGLLGLAVAAGVYFLARAVMRLPGAEDSNAGGEGSPEPTPVAVDVRPEPAAPAVAPPPTVDAQVNAILSDARPAYVRAGERAGAKA